MSLILTKDKMDDSENAGRTSLSEMQNRLLEILGRDLFGADLKLSVFISGLESYRYDSVLRPFPPIGLKDDGSKDVQKLTQLCSSMPKLSAIIKDKQESRLSEEGWYLLDWLMRKTLDIKTLEKSMFQEIENKTGQSSYTSTEPDYVFEVKYHDNCSLNKRFEELAANYDILYAYHGSGLDNFHSILHNGLHSHLNKTSLFGEGTYLSSDLNISMAYSKYNKIWPKSALGHRMSCIAVCEVLDHPDVKCTLKSKTQNGQVTSLSTRARAKNSEGGDVPERYYIVTNNELLRVKYLLVYVDKRPSERTSSWSWFTWFLIAYIFILAVLGFTRSRLYTNIQSKIYGDQSEL